MSKNKTTYKIIGILICLISCYWIIKTGYHLINYKVTGGLENNVFAHPKNYQEIVIVFLFWLLQLFGGIGLIKSNKIGLKIGMISTFIGGIFAFIYSMFISNYKMNYSTQISTNGIEREMSMAEKWKIIYIEPLSYILLTFFLLLVAFWVFKRIKEIKENTSLQQRV